MIPGFSFLTTLIAGLGAWGVRAMPGSVVGGGVVVGLALTGAGATTDFDWLLNVGVLFAAVFLGVALGRIIPPRSRPMFGLLVVLSVADIIWIVSGGGSATGWVDEVFNFSVRMGTSSSTIGTVDLLLASTVATHWAQRRGSVWLGRIGGPHRHDHLEHLCGGQRRRQPCPGAFHRHGVARNRVTASTNRPSTADPYTTTRLSAARDMAGYDGGWQCAGAPPHPVLVRVHLTSLRCTVLALTIRHSDQNGAASARSIDREYVSIDLWIGHLSTGADAWVRCSV